jgi:serine/threonine protein kinase
MSMKIGPFEIQSELAKSPTGTVYKAADPESGQTVALKAIQLSAFGEGAVELEKALLAEAEKTKVLSSPNITPLLGAGEIEGPFCASMEYVQGNSIATMLARKEGFSIWDLLDIGRQLCSGLDHAASHNIVHYSLEPAKIMCGWDGTVKILSFGVSSVGNFVQYLPEGVPTILHYMSPEQVQGRPMDVRSNLFSLGAMFYEMVTERKAFDREDAASLRESIVESTPVPPVHVSPKVHPLLSDLIMKALSKDPAQRYASGRALLDDLEKCKESKTLAAKKPEPAKGTVVPKAGAAPSKFITPAAKAAGKAPDPASPSGSKPASVQSSASGSGLARRSGLRDPASRPAPADSEPRKPETAPAVENEFNAVPPAKTAAPLASPKAVAAAAGAGSRTAPASSTGVPEIDFSDRFISAAVKATMAAGDQAPPVMSSAVVDEPEVETFEPQVGTFAPQPDDRPAIAVDPIMAEKAASGGGGTSFSEISELPPLKEVYVAPPPPPVFQAEQSVPQAPTVFSGAVKHDEKPKVQPREVAEKAIKQIRSVPHKLMLYALGGAAALILAIGIGVTVYVHQQNSDDDSTADRPAAKAEAPAQPAVLQPAPKAAVKNVTPAPPPQEEASEPEPAVTRSAPAAKVRNAKKRALPPAPVIIPGQLAVDSTPQGAQVQVDGRTDASYVTPFALTNLQPGQHSIAVSKAGYSTDARSVAVTSGNRATIVVHLAQLMATLVVNSDPAGASIYVDGRDAGTKTPAQVSVDKGQHVVLVRKMGYIDETMNGQFVLGQTFTFAPALRPLGNADNIRTVGKMSKLFGGKGAQAGQATVSIRTQPKGAQVAINQHLMEKSSPLDIALDPGNYVIDITLTGYAPVHKVITADKGGKVVVNEVMQPQ